MGRVLGLSFDETNAITKNIDEETIEEVLANGTIKEWQDKYPELFTYVEKLSGLPKSFGVHPCFVGNTLVLTDTGYKYISDVQVGDKVLTHKGDYKFVVNTSHTQNNTYLITQYGGCNIECTGNHPFYVRHRIQGVGHKRIYTEPEWVEAKDLIKSDMVCHPINNKQDIPIYKNLPTNEEDFWWIVGRYIGDGWCLYFKQPRNTKNVIICCDNKDDTKLNDIILRVKKYFEYRYEKDKATYRIYVKSIEMFEFLQRFGKYAYGKHLSNDVIDLPVNLIRSFLEGYLSADGHRCRDGYYSFKTVSFKLAVGLMQCIIKVYHVSCGFYIVKPCVDTIQGRKVNSKEKYCMAFKPNVTSKNKCFYDKENNCMWCYVKSVTETNSDIKDVYNLTVVDDNSYTANGVAVHNCGRCITQSDAVTYNAIEYNADVKEWALQGDMHTADDLGLVKCDFLGLRTLDVIYDVLGMIGKDYNYIAPHKIDTSDPAVWNEFAKGNTDCIFQFESGGMKAMLKDMHCNCIENLSAANALYRPGAKAFIPNYVNRKIGKEEIQYLHPDLEPILKNSYGIILFQEQLIEIGRLANLPNPDELRKATAKKKPELMAKIEPLLKQGLINRGWSEELCNKLWETILDFARYSFNKCIVGDTEIPVTDVISHNNPYLTVETMYNIAKMGYGYFNTLSLFPDGRIRTNHIVNIQQSGEQPIFRVETITGKSVECTLNHKFPTPNGDTKLVNLSVGDVLYCVNRSGRGHDDWCDVYEDRIISIKYVRTAMTYDVTMDDPAHNFVVNNGLITCNSHSSAYALTAYISMYLKVHHPNEFITACINSYDEIRDIIKTIHEGKRMGLKIIFPKWREVESRTFTKDGVIYLGLNTIKGFGNSVAPALKEIATESKSFMDVIIHCKQSGVISETQIETLIIHDFFSEFGDRDKLLAVYDIFKKVYGRKQFNKDGDLPVSADILAKFSKETAKQYREVRTDELMEYLVENSAVHKLSLQAVLAAELRDFGYINYQDPNLEKTFYVTDVNTKYSPKISFYNMKNGMVFEAKVNKKYFCNNPLCVGNIIKGDFTVKPKMTKQGDEFVLVPNTREFWAKNYTVI